MAKLQREGDLPEVLSKADSLSKVEFEAEISRSISAVFKMEDDFLIWGPASVEIVDKEDDKVSSEALEGALPQLLKRGRLSYAHTDQIVGKILNKFETEDSVEVTIDGKTYERSEFPTDVLELGDDEPPAMFVAGEVYDDTEQSVDVRRKIEQGEIDSYSISGEALVTQKEYDNDGRSYDNILELDLSAVTLCEEGMNPSAKFARVDTESADVKSVVGPNSDSDVEKEAGFSVASGGVSEPKTIAKSMSEQPNTVDIDPDSFIKRDEVEGDIATKSFVEKAVEEEVEKVLPDGNLATVSYIKEMHGEEDEEEDEEKAEGEMPDDYEEDEEEMEGDEMERGSGDLSRETLKEDLPEDVWKIVSEYVGDAKGDYEEEEEEEEKAEDEEEDEMEEKDIEKQVQQILSDPSESPTPGVSDRDDEVEKNFELGDEDDEGGSPALQNFDHHK